MRQKLTEEEESALTSLINLVGGLGRRNSLGALNPQDRKTARALATKGYVTIAEGEFSVTTVPFKKGS
jgi:hypothetical protein